jgi:hypothetical protein
VNADEVQRLRYFACLKAEFDGLADAFYHLVERLPLQQLLDLL